MANDPDAGVRRELILAFRNLPTDAVGDSLRKLTALWDGQDRWYLEALGLALEKRESDFLSMLFDGNLFGAFDHQKGWCFGVTLRFRPISRSTETRHSSQRERWIARPQPISKYLGLAWRIHRREVLPLVERLLPDLKAVDLQQAADDVLERMSDPQTADLVARMTMGPIDPAHQRTLLALLARRLGGDWQQRKRSTAGCEGHRTGAR